MYLEKSSLSLEAGGGIRDAIRMLTIISELNLHTDEELYACSIDWKVAFGRVNWTKLM